MAERAAHLASCAASDTATRVAVSNRGRKLLPSEDAAVDAALELGAQSTEVVARIGWLHVIGKDVYRLRAVPRHVTGDDSYYLNDDIVNGYL